MKKVLLTALWAVSLTFFTQAKPVNHSPATDPDKPERPSIISDLLQYARRHLSVRYRSGGTSPRGFDCSGFTRFCFSRFGISLPHSSAAQHHTGVAVEKETAEPGDLIFFSGSSRSRSRVGHVGLITDVIGHRIKFIHSASGKGIRYDWLDASYYRSRFMGIRRVELTN